jgi:hypothetical protein
VSIPEPGRGSKVEAETVTSETYQLFIPGVPLKLPAI